MFLLSDCQMMVDSFSLQLFLLTSRSCAEGHRELPAVTTVTISPKVGGSIAESLLCS